MYKHILIPTDGSEVAQKAIDAGMNYARESGAKVLLFTAVPEYEPPSEAELFARHRIKSVFEYEKEAETSAREILDRAAAVAKDANIAFETEFRRDERVMRFLTVTLDKHAISWAERRRAKIKTKA